MAQPSSVAGYQHEGAWDQGWLRVDDIHEVYYQQYGKTDGKPAMFLHGGPGARCSKANTAYFDPAEYRVILLDQRGCGKSRPTASLTNNTTWHVVSDVEALRKHLNINKWHVVFGGSWGSALALAYAQMHPDVVGSLILRGVCTARAVESRWLNSPRGAAMLFPDKFEPFINFLPEDERSDHIVSYHKRLMSDDTTISHPAVQAWNAWEVPLSTLYPDLNSVKYQESPGLLLQRARIEIHYIVNHSWLEDGQLLRKESIDKIKHIPTTIVQGRYDMVCPPTTAWELHKSWPETKLIWSEDAGHAASEPSTKEKLIEACQAHAKLSA
ncbi:hypothetical protein EKO04_008045 [Ascochyta lentis]|uniref:Proline iminopeptidase n=1 Tax=Ascochyta lentis TaxID=205686 RepID=A0A8H7J1I8_9PLEO|nr:hypothetical protein EKO04_008045 [Ascochyta lentis]